MLHICFSGTGIVPSLAFVLSELKKAAFIFSYPRKVGSTHGDLLLDLCKQGHEVYPHGWSHIQWQRNLDNIDVERHLCRCIDSYRQIFGFSPIGFGSPGRQYDSRTLRCFDKIGLEFIGDMDGTRPFIPSGYSHLQIPVTLFRTIEELRRTGLDDHQISRVYLSHLKEHSDFAVIYEHPDNLHARELRILDSLYAGIIEAGLEVVTFSEIAARSSELRQ